MATPMIMEVCAQGHRIKVLHPDHPVAQEFLRRFSGYHPTWTGGGKLVCTCACGAAWITRPSSAAQSCEGHGAEAIRAHYTDPDTCSQYLLPGHVLGRIRAQRRADAERRKNDVQLRAIEGAKQDAAVVDHHGWAQRIRTELDEWRAAREAENETEVNSASGGAA